MGGVELSQARWEVSRKFVADLDSQDNNMRIPSCDCAEDSELVPRRVGIGLDFVRSSFLDVDFTDADIIFVCSVVFSNDLVAELAQISRWMKPGSRIVSYHVFPGPEFN